MNYELYGLRVRSEVPLGAPECEGGCPDVDVRWAESCTVPDDPPAGEIVARLQLPDGSGYTHSRSDSGYTLRFHGTCDFQLDDGRRSVCVHLASGADPGVVPVLLAGNVLAFILMAAGECVLHASAVEIGGAALAFMGGAGMGKSTLAALVCAAGGTLIADDLLRVEHESGRCFPGPPEVRLRHDAAVLAAWFPATVSRVTPDNRIALRLTRRPGNMTHLHAIVIPHPSRTFRALRLERLRRPEAAFRVLCHQRVLGWRGPEGVRERFRAVVHLAERIPVYEAEVPWGPPFDAAGVMGLLEGVCLCGQPVEASA